MSADNRLVELAAAVGDGVPVDWMRVEHESDARSAEVIRHLRLVERIASVHTAASLARFSSSSPSSSGHVGDSATAWEPGSMWGSLVVGERLGRGTYGDVYAARDVRLDRPVALKLLHRTEADEGSGVVVIQEARLLARVRHPNVVTVYGAERIDGRVGIWMELVEGRTLEDELGERGPFPPGEIAAIGAALTSGVSAVHAAGLLHRDIKAHNVMRGRDGRILLADFGTGRDATREGSLSELAGTPLYLAPELLEGEPASVASDVYGVGVLLYHLATGAYPVSGRSMPDLRDAFLTDRRAPLRERRRNFPPALAAVIERALDPVPSRRYQSAADVGAGLVATGKGRWRAFTMAATAALLALAAVIGLQWHTGSASDSPRFVLVGAFVNETGDSRLDEVVQIAFAHELMQSREVAVVPPERIADSLRLMKRPASVSLDARTAREVALRDGAIQLIATGRIDRLSSRYALSVAIYQAVGGAPVARARVEVADIDSLLDGVRSLAAAVRAAVGEDRGQVASDLRLARVTTGSLDALLDYTAGLALVDQRRWAAAELRLADAVRRDPTFASALIMLAHCRRNQPARDDFMAVAEQARRLAEDLPARERYFIEGSFHQLNGDLPQAIAAYEVLAREQPNDFWGLNNLSIAYVQSGRWREEIPFLQRLVLLRPNDTLTLVSSATRLVAAGEGVSDAIELANRASTLERPPGIPGMVFDAWVKLLPAFAAWAEGRVADAAVLLDGFEGVTPDSDEHAFRLGKMNLALGRVQAAERAFQRMPDLAEREALLGYAAFARGDTAGAHAMLTRAVAPLIESIQVTERARVVGLCWALLQAGLAEECGRVTVPIPGGDRPGWLLGELAARAGDDNAALRELQRLVANVPPGDFRYVLAVDAIARLLERRGDLAGAAAALRRLDGAQRAAYARSGAHGFEWLVARAHLLELERRLGQTDSAKAVARDLERWLAVADSDFVIRASLP